jgi:parallel beta-helix repeat protein
MREGRMKRIVSGTMLALLLMGILTLPFGIQPANASETIYIRADGSVDPPTAPISTIDNVTYTFVDNIYDLIVVERDNIVIDGSGYTIQGTRTLGSMGIDLKGRSNVIIKNTNIEALDFGIGLDSSSGNSISGNSITNNEYGIRLDNSSENSINENNITNNEYGIRLDNSSENSINENNITENNLVGGIYLYSSSGNSISRNNLTANNYFGIRLDYSSENSINENNITNNGYGIQVAYSSNNNVCHNNFFNNSLQVGSVGSANVWDDGYPYGGNYWSDYTGLNLYSGPSQNESGSDGIGDSPNVIDVGNVDHYPLMASWTIRPVTATVYMDPDALNLRSRMQWIASYIELGEGYDVNNVNVSTIMLNNTVPAELSPTALGDYDNDTILDLMVEFNRTRVAEYLLSEGIMTGNVTLTITGQLSDGTLLEGSVVIRVRMPGDVNMDGKVDVKDLLIPSKAFGASSGTLRWNSIADENEDGKINIIDLFIVARNFGKTYP